MMKWMHKIKNMPLQPPVLDRWANLLFSSNILCVVIFRGGGGGAGRSWNWLMHKTWPWNSNIQCTASEITEDWNRMAYWCGAIAKKQEQQQTNNRQRNKNDIQGRVCLMTFFVDAVSLCHRKKTWRDDELSGIKRKSNTTSGLPNKRMVSNEYSR